MLYGPFKELGVTELIGINEVIAQNEYSKSVALTLDPGGKARSGSIEQISIIMTEDGTGAIQAVDGKLIFLDADPAVAAADTALTAAEWLTVLGWYDIVNTDFVSDANGGFVFYNEKPVRFHALATIYAVFFLESATSINSVAGDDEQMELNLHWRAAR